MHDRKLFVWNGTNFQAGYSQLFIDAFVVEATAGNYDDFLATVMRYVVVE